MLGLADTHCITKNQNAYNKPKPKSILRVLQVGLMPMLIFVVLFTKLSCVTSSNVIIFFCRSSVFKRQKKWPLSSKLLKVPTD